MTGVFLVEELIANGGTADGLPARPATAPVVEAALVQFEGSMQPALLLEDGAAVVLSFEQMRELSNAFAEWQRMFMRAPSAGRTSAKVSKR